MSKMADLDLEIRNLLDSTRWSIDEIANYCQCPTLYVEIIVEERWQKIVRDRETMSPFETINS
jgi:hypothetical protein